MTEPLAYTIGFLLGDGYFQLTPQGRKFVRVAKPDLEPIERIRDEVQEFCGVAYTISQKAKHVKGDYWGVDMTNVKLWDYIYTITKCKTEIPDWWQEWDKDSIAAMLSGLIDSDGYVAGPNSQGKMQMAFTNNRQSLVNAVYEMCQFLEIHTGQVGEFEGTSKGKQYTHYRITINLQSFKSAGIQLTCKRKQAKIDLYEPQRLVTRPPITG